MGDYIKFNEIYEQELIGHRKPARATVQVSKLPLGALVEIAVIAKQKSE